MSQVKADWRHKKIAEGPYKGLTHKDGLFREVAKALRKGEEVSIEELQNVFPEDERNSRGTVKRWRDGWQDWLLDQRPPGCKTYRCGLSESAPNIPKLSWAFAEQIRNKLRVKRNTRLAVQKPSRRPNNEAEESPDYHDSEYKPQNSDERTVVERQIKERRGQPKFRDALRQRYRGRCLVTGCDVWEVLEAAHIKPYRGENDNNPTNGLLLRTDIHTLFDLDLIGIEPNRLEIQIAAVLANDNQYKKLAGIILNCGDRSPSRKALELRYKQFQERNGTQQ